MPFLLKSSHHLEGTVCKISFKFEICQEILDIIKKMRQTNMTFESMPRFESIQIKINFPADTTETALMPSQGTFKFSLKDSAGLWSIN